MKTIVKALSALIMGILCLFTNVIAGGVVEFSTGAGTKTIVAHDSLVISTKVRDQIAVTATRQVFHSTYAQPTVVRYGIPVPENATVTSVAYRTKGVWKSARISSSDTMNNNTGGGGSVVRDNLTAVVGDMALVFPFADTIGANESLAIEVTWVELMKYSAGSVTYAYPTQAVRGRSANEWNLDVRSERTIRSYSIMPVFGDRIADDRSISQRGPIVSLQNNDLSMTIHRELIPGVMDILSYKSGSNDGYALFATIPAVQAQNASDNLTKKVCLLYDISGSMQGIKYQQATDAVSYCLDKMRPTDYVSVIAFSNDVYPLSNGMQKADPATIAELKNQVRSRGIEGGTDIMKALTAALAQFTSSNDVNTIIFITDGIAQIDFDNIIQRNMNNVRIYVFGIGQDVSADALRRISADNRGEVDLITDAGDVSERIAAFFSKISVPVIKDPKVSFSPDVVYDVCPLSIPDLYKDEQFVVAGRYRTAGPIDVTLEGESASGHTSIVYPGKLLADSITYQFVPKLWAKMRISALLDLMSKEPGQTDRWKEWRAEIIRLGNEYSLVTPFTTFITRTDDQPQPTAVYDYPVVHTTFDMYPNPAMTSITLEFDLFEDVQHITVEMVDMSGKVVGVVVLDGNYSQHVRLPLNLSAFGSLSSGAYIVRVVAGNYISTSTLTIQL